MYSQRLVQVELDEIDRKIAHLNELRQKLEHDLTKLDEEDLELKDEC